MPTQAYDPKCLCEYLVVVNADSIERYIDLSGYARNLSNGTIIADRTNVNLNGLDFIDGVLLKGQTLILDPLTKQQLFVFTTKKSKCLLDTYFLVPCCWGFFSHRDNHKGNQE
ncbi:hypothetical protein MGH68_03240 [Erysipelothrix sp. D19-032]